MRRLLMLPTAFLVGIAEIACTATTRGDRFLDVTQAVVLPEPGHMVEGATQSVGGHQERTLVPLGVRVLKTDRHQYRRMETVAYDVSVLNQTQVPLVIPWSPFPINRRDRPASGYRHALFEFELVDRLRREAVVDTYVLYGSPTVPGSLKELKPGQHARIRLPAILSGSGYQDERNPVLHPTPGLQARVHMSVYAPDDPLFRSGETVSDNAVPIAIAPTLPVIAEPTPDPRPPQIVEVAPRLASAGVIIRLDGYRFGAGRRDHGLDARVLFINGDIRLSVDLNVSSWVENDRSHGLQQLAVEVPRGVFPGTWTVSVGRERSVSNPFPLLITEWQPPRVDGLWPQGAPRGATVHVWGGNFRVDDAIELTDALGVVHTSGSSTLGAVMVVVVPPGAAEGLATVRIRASTTEGQVASQPLSLRVTSGPSKPSTAERGLPPALARIFAAETRAEAMEIARHGPTPVVDLMQVGPTQQMVMFWNGPDRPTRVTAMQGDDLVLHFPAPRSGVFRVTLTGRRRHVLVTSDRPDDHHVHVRLPKRLSGGPWHVEIASESSDTVMVLPIDMYVLERPK